MAEIMPKHHLVQSVTIFALFHMAEKKTQLEKHFA